MDLWGHSFKCSYSLELILDFWEKIVFCVFYVFFLIPEILIPNTLDQNTWWGGRPRAPPWPPSNLAPHQSWSAGWPGHHVCGLPTFYGFPTMYLASPPCILIKGIRYPGIQIPDVQISRYPDIRYHIPDIRNNTEKLPKLVFPQSQK